jgi:lipoprotein-anchoring transpeptidase ErfK/SrfK
MPLQNGPSRRQFLATSASLATLLLAGCAPSSGDLSLPGSMDKTLDYKEIYGPMDSEPHAVKPINLHQVNKRLYRRRIKYQTDEPVGSIIVDTDRFYLYLVEEGGTAMRYGVSLGKEGFAWSGRAKVGWKKKWPTWTPPPEMLERKPEFAEFSKGMPGGSENPLGARALYIMKDGKDTLYRIHGTPAYWSIGRRASSGCVRMINQDIIDLYDRVPKGAQILVV